MAASAACSVAKEYRIPDRVCRKVAFILADKAFQSWKANERLVTILLMVVYHYDRISSSIQLNLTCMQERPNTFDGAVTLACQLESMESAQRMLQTAKHVETPSEDTTN